MKKYSLLLLLVFCHFWGMAQSAVDTPEMADRFRADGKIYVVLAVIVVIFIGLAFYLIQLDKKITRLEKNK
jgi:CcmD family protein